MSLALASDRHLFAAIGTTGIGQMIAATVACDWISGRLELGPAGLVATRRTYWGEPKDPRWLTGELNACGHIVTSIHPLGPAVYPACSIGDVRRRCTAVVCCMPPELGHRAYWMPASDRPERCSSDPDRQPPADLGPALQPGLIARDVGLDLLDDWQSRLIDQPPKRLLCLCGRQVGKSTAAAVCALNAVIYSAPAIVVMISPSMRQSVELFRTFSAMYRRLPTRPAAEYETLQRVELENGSRVISLPGSGDTVRGIAKVDLVILDEAARVPDGLLAAVRPMLAVSDGALFALSTPAGRRGWFHQQWENGVGWQRISIKSTDCPRISPEFLAEEREQLGAQLFAQEYLCAFNDEVGAAFLSELVDRAFIADITPYLRTDMAQAVARSA